MANAYISNQKDLHGHLSLIILVISALLLLYGFTDVASVIAATIGFLLLYLYYTRIKILPIYTRTPVSDAIIALGGLTSTLYLISELTSNGDSSFLIRLDPRTSLLLILLGLISKLFLFEEFFKEILNKLGSYTNFLTSWVVNNRKNQLRTLLFMIGFSTYTFTIFLPSNVNNNMLRSISYISISIILLLDLKDVKNFGFKRKLVYFIISFILLVGIVNPGSDSTTIGNRILALSLILTSFDKNSMYQRIIFTLQRVNQSIFSYGLLIKIVLIGFILTLARKSYKIAFYIRNNIGTILRILSGMIGVILFMVPTTSGSILLSSTLYDIIGTFLIFLAFLPNIVKLITIYGVLLYFIINNFLRNSYHLIIGTLLGITNWVRHNHVNIIRLSGTVLSLIIFLNGPEQFNLNLYLSSFLLITLYWTFLVRIYIIIKTHIQNIIGYFMADVTRFIGFSGILALIISILLRNEYPVLGSALLVISAFSLVIGWDFTVFRALDRVVNSLIIVFNTVYNYGIMVLHVLYGWVTIRRFVSFLSWVAFILAIFDLLLNRLFLFLVWLIVWHVAYNHRVTRVQIYLKQIYIFSITSIYRIFIILGSFFKTLGNTIYYYINRGIYIMFNNFYVVILWTIGVVLLSIGIGLILPMPLEPIRAIFGTIVEDNLVSFIIGFTLFSAAILSIQQTYANRAKLKIGALTG